MNQPNTRRSMARRLQAVGVLLVVGLIIGGVFYYWKTISETFEAQHAAYVLAAGEYTRSAYIPAAQENPVRQEVNRILSRVLIQEMTPAERVALAERGIAHLKDIDGQIDAIGAAGDAASTSLELLEKSLPAYSIFGVGSEIRDIEALAKKRSDIIADIRGLSYRANFHTSQIFKRIIEDNGSLTDAHKTELNNSIPELEEQFDRRTNLYTELEATDASLGTQLED